MEFLLSFELWILNFPPPERQRRGPNQPGPTAQEPPPGSIAGLKARYKTLGGRHDLHGAGLQPLTTDWIATWAAGPDWNEDGPLALAENLPLTCGEWKGQVGGGGGSAAL